MGFEEQSDKKTHLPVSASSASHYHGDVVRKLFVMAAVLILIVLPFLGQSLQIPFGIFLFVIIVIDLFAGLTSPAKKLFLIINVLISVIAILIFASSAVSLYKKDDLGLLFWVNQTLALIFLFALYYSTKTLRARILE